MSNTSKGRSERGSKFWMQTLVEYPKLKSDFDQIIGERLEWLSPIKSEDYVEYQLNQKKILKNLHISKERADNMFSCWPSRQPQWDGIAIGMKTRTLYIVEAKAHTSELETKCTASGASKKMIENAMYSVYQENYGTGNFDKWMDGYYQMANRLTFLQIMKNVCSDVFDDVKLVLLNFVDDNSLIPTNESEWKEYCHDVWNVMIGRDNAPADVVEAYFKVSGYGIMPSPRTGEVIKRSKYAKAQIDEMLRDCYQHMDKFYKSPVINYKGKLKDVDDKYTEYISMTLFDVLADYGSYNLLEVDEIKDLDEKDTEGLLHKVQEIEFTDTNRVEENIAKSMVYNQEFFNDMQGNRIWLVDYQVPVSRVAGSEHGKIDLIGVSDDKKTIYLCELKDYRSQESLLRATLEIQTYYQKVSKEKIRRCCGNEDSEVRKCVIIFPETRPYHDFENDARVKRLMDKFNVETVRAVVDEPAHIQYDSCKYNLKNITPRNF